MGRAGRIAFAAVVIEGLVSTLARHYEPSGSPMKGAVVVASIVFLALGVSYELQGRIGVGRYLAFQNFLAAAIVWLSHGHAGLAPLPIISQSALCLPRRWVLLAAFLHTANAVLLVAHFYGWSRVWPLVAGFLAAEVFVIAFTDVASGERKAHTELALANRKLSEYAAQATELATVKERNRLARELHDSLGHYLTVIHVQLQAAESQLGRDADRARQALATAMRLTHDGLEDVRRSVAALRASPMDRGSLSDAIATLVSELLSSGIEARLSVHGVPRPLSPAVELALFRAAQEALTNVHKHARARHAEVTLDYGPGSVSLRVADDGRGAPVDHGLGFGLLGVRERVALVGGELTIKRAPGFVLTFTIPT